MSHKTVTPTNAFAYQRLTHDYLSALLVTGLTILALFFGWGVKSLVENRSQSVEQEGIVADIPTGWLMQAGAGDFIFQVRNPNDLSQQYHVYLLPASMDLSSRGKEQSDLRSQLDETYRVLDEDFTVVDKQEMYRVHYATVDIKTTGMPALMEGITYYFHADDKILAVSVEGKQADFANMTDQFHRFLKSVEYEGVSNHD